MFWIMQSFLLWNAIRTIHESEDEHTILQDRILRMPNSPEKKEEEEEEEEKKTHLMWTKTNKIRNKMCLVEKWEPF